VAWPDSRDLENGTTLRRDMRSEADYTTTPHLLGRRYAPLQSAGLAACVLACLAASFSAGCGRRAPVVDETEARSQEALRVIAAAYGAAITKRGKPPAGPDDIKPFLPAGVSVDDALRSPRDGQPFVVLWGADPRKGMDVKPLVNRSGRRSATTTRDIPQAGTGTWSAGATTHQPRIPSRSTVVR
jgi:hypothetical protein